MHKQFSQTIARRARTAQQLEVQEEESPAGRVKEIRDIPPKRLAIITIDPTRLLQFRGEFLDGTLVGFGAEMHDDCVDHCRYFNLSALLSAQ